MEVEDRAWQALCSDLRSSTIKQRLKGLDGLLVRTRNFVRFSTCIPPPFPLKVMMPHPPCPWPLTNPRTTSRMKLLYESKSASWWTCHRLCLMTTTPRYVGSVHSATADTREGGIQ